MESIGTVQPPWTIIPIETILKTCYSGAYSPSIEETVANILQLKDYKFDLADACIVDFFVTIIWWCKEQQFAPEQAGVVLDIARRQLADVKLKKASVIDSIRDLKMATADLIVKTNASQPSIPQEKLADFVKFMSNMLVQHHKLWEFFFHRLHEETVICKQFVVETAPAASVPWPPPLFEGCPESLYRTYVNPQAPKTAATTTKGGDDRTTVSTAQTQQETSRGQSSTTPAVTPAPKTQESGTASKAETTPKPTGEKKPVMPPKQSSLDEETRAQLEAAAEKTLILDRETIKQLVEKTSRDVAQVAEQEILAKIRERENTFLTKINQVHKTSD